MKINTDIPKPGDLVRILKVFRTSAHFDASYDLRFRQLVVTDVQRCHWEGRHLLALVGHAPLDPLSSYCIFGVEVEILRKGE